MRLINKEHFGSRWYELNFIEKALVIYLFLGSFISVDSLNIARYMLALLIQIYVFGTVLLQKKKYKITLNCYLNVLFVVVLIALNFFIINVPFITGMNRILPILSVFGMVIIGETEQINIGRVLHFYVKIYIALIAFVNIDSFMFILGGNAIWEPISYLGHRYCGPFGDPNFMALFSGAILIIVILNGKVSKIRYIFSIVMLLLNILLADSLSTYIFLAITFIFGKCFKDKNLLKKQIIFLGFYFCFITLYGIFSDEISKGVTHWLEILYNGNTFKAQAKYTSLEIRLDTQYRAIKAVIEHIWGQGPLQIVSQLGHDTHNSYVGFLFEQGILGLYLIIITVSRAIKSNKYTSHISTFLFLSGILLNIHYTTIYSLFLMLQYLENGNQSFNYESREVVT